MNSMILVTGGARSGKSSYALDRCSVLGEKKCFIATCPVVDPEMDDRILRHKNERNGLGWISIEEETKLVEAIENARDYDIILIDCLTLWINNLMYRAECNRTPFDEEEVLQEANKLGRAIKSFDGTVCLVTNEVGLGIVPDNKLARKYRDLVGSCNRILGQKADEVILVSCGIPLPLKSR